MSDSVAPVAPVASSPAPAAPAASPVTTKAPGDTTKPVGNTPGGPPAPMEFTKRQYKGKVDKQERVWELSDEEVAVRLQKSEAAESRFQKAAEMQKKWEQLQQIAKEDPDALIKELAGVDPYEYAQRKVEEKWKLEVMPEQERKLYELQKQIKAYQEKEAKQAAALAAENKTKAERAAEAKLEADFQRAFEVSGLEYNEDNLEVFGQLVLAAHDNGLEYTPEQLAAEAKARIAERHGKYESQIKTRVGSLKGPELLDFLGEATVKEVLRAAVARHQPKAPEETLAPVSPANAGTKTQDRDSKGKYMSTADWRRAFGKT